MSGGEKKASENVSFVVRKGGLPFSPRPWGGEKSGHATTASSVRGASRGGLGTRASMRARERSREPGVPGRVVGVAARARVSVVSAAGGKKRLADAPATRQRPSARARAPGRAPAPPGAPPPRSRTRVSHLELLVERPLRVLELVQGPPRPRGPRTLAPRAVRSRRARVPRARGATARLLTRRVARRLDAAQELAHGRVEVARVRRERPRARTRVARARRRHRARRVPSRLDRARAECARAEGTTTARILADVARGRKAKGRNPRSPSATTRRQTKAKRSVWVRGVETNNQPFSIQAVPRVRVTLRDKKQTDAIPQIGEL